MSSPPCGKDAPTLNEDALHRAIVRVLKRFHDEDSLTYLTLMKATIGEAIGINGTSDEMELLERRVEALNKRMLSLVNEVVASGDDMEAHEDEFRHISEETEQLKRRVQAIQEAMNEDASYQDKLKEIQAAIEHREENADTYDDSIVRQMIECIKVYPDRKLEVYFGGGYRMEEYVEKK